jgi:23S rRNA pseudouridine1911/1915/1917 synthase
LLHHDEEHFRELLDEEMRPGIVHRLDKDTSGAMVVAKHEEAYWAMKRAFAERRVEKTYLALVLGEFGTVTGRIETLIGRNPVHREKMAVVQEGGKEAITGYRVLNAAQDVSLVEVRIETGRTHQIRVHFAHLRHPVLGDPVYGGRRREMPISVKRQMLHAWKLVLPHPRTGVMCEYRVPPPEDFLDALAALGMPDYWRHAKR